MANKVLDKLGEVLAEYHKVNAGFENLQKSYHRFQDQTENQIDKINNENEDIRRRLTSIEGLLDSTIKASMAVAVKEAIKEYLENGGSLKELQEETIKNQLQKKNN